VQRKEKKGVAFYAQYFFLLIKYGASFFAQKTNPGAFI
jgi:hypothetical protein